MLMWRGHPLGYHEYRALKNVLLLRRRYWRSQHIDNHGPVRPLSWISPVGPLSFKSIMSQIGIVVMFTASGLLVRFLKVFEKSGYQSVKWVRYLSKANGSYQIRVSFVGPDAERV